MMTADKVKQKQTEQTVAKAIRAVLLRIVDHPLLHFSEKSMQVELASKLLANSDLSTPVKSGILKEFGDHIANAREEDHLDRANKTLEKAIKIRPLQMEYGLEKINGRGGHRIDIAILPKDAIQNIDTWQYQQKRKGGNAYIQPSVGVELGTEKSGWNKMAGAHLESDIRKLSKCRAGYILYVMRNTTVARPGTKSFANKENQMRKYKESFTRSAKQGGPSVRFVSIINHIALSKVELFCRNNQWRVFQLPDKSSELMESMGRRLGL